jgi:hypothetical protein
LSEGRGILSQDSTVEAILLKSRRQTVPVRTTFLQRGPRGRPEPGPLAGIVRGHDRRGLLLYLLFLAAASSPPWDVALPSTVWGRAIALRDPASVSRTWRRLSDRYLVRRERRGRVVSIVALKEDGSGEAYSHPARVGDTYFQIPFPLWTTRERWYRSLSLSELGVLLIALSLSDGFILPVEKAPPWYGISPDTAAHGLEGLHKKGLLTVSRHIRETPLSAIGYTEDRRYTLQEPFGPRGHLVLYPTSPDELHERP